MMSEPLVSVVVATYRRTDALCSALMSLAEQTYRNIEVVLVDDNANEEWNRETQRIVEQVRAKTDVKINYIVNPVNKGSAATRNIGIAASEGEFITFLDDDDVYLPDKVGMQLAAMQNADADYSLTDLKLYDEKDRMLEHRTRDYIKRTDIDSLFGYHLMYHMTGTDTLMFRADYLRKIGGFPPIDVGDEFYLMSAAIQAGGKVCYVPGCEVKAYVHTGEGGLSSGMSKINGENALFDYKKGFFDRIGRKQRGYIRMRHHAVLAFAYLRQRKLLPFFLSGIKAFVAAPVACVCLLIKGR